MKRLLTDVSVLHLVKKTFNYQLLNRIDLNNNLAMQTIEPISYRLVEVLDEVVYSGQHFVSNSYL